MRFQCLAAMTPLCIVAVSLACGGRHDNTRVSPDVLLFNGTGTSPNDVAAIEKLLEGSRIGYSTADSAQLNAMSGPKMRGYRLLIMPGGNFIDMGNSLTAGATANVRSAVRGGLNYLGICAGGFLAGKYNQNSLDLAGGVKFGFYAAESRGIRNAAVAIESPGSPTLDQYWEDGPEFSGWGAVVAMYPDKTPAIVEGTFGKGLIILSGIHAEAPETWRRGMTFRTPAEVDNGYAATLISAALNRTPLPHY